jgi:hypothetical protein
VKKEMFFFVIRRQFSIFLFIFYIFNNNVKGENIKTKFIKKGANTIKKIKKKERREKKKNGF